MIRTVPIRLTAALSERAAANPARRAAGPAGHEKCRERYLPLAAVGGSHSRSAGRRVD